MRGFDFGQPADAIEPLRLALERQPQDDNIRRNLAIAQSHLGLHGAAYPTMVRISSGIQKMRMH